MKNELVWRKITDPKSGEKRKWDFRSKGGLWVVLAKFSPTNGIFNKMGFSKNILGEIVVFEKTNAPKAQRKNVVFKGENGKFRSREVKRWTLGCAC